MKQAVKSMKTKLSKTFDKNLEWQLQNSNPIVPKLYALPKIHKANHPLRFIVSHTNSYTENIAKWLLKQFNKLT